MKVEYSLEPDIDVAFEEEDSNPTKLTIDGTDVSIELDENLTIKEIKVVFTGLPLQWAREDLINPEYPETRNKAYKIFCYLLDRILIQTTQNAFDLKSVSNIKNNVLPETEEEARDYQNHRKQVRQIMTFNYSLLGSANLSDFKEKYHLSQAFSNFADAVKSDNLITKYERFYKIIETFFNDRGPTLDGKVSRFVKKYNPEFSTSEFTHLRILRNRCIHPQKKGHISSNDPDSVQEVSRQISKLESIARLMLENPLK